MNNGSNKSYCDAGILGYSEVVTDGEHTWSAQSLRPNDVSRVRKMIKERRKA